MPPCNGARVVNGPGTVAARREASEAYGWYVVFVLCICGIVAFIDRQIINLLVEDIRADLQITDVQISLIGAEDGYLYLIPNPRRNQSP